MKVTRLISIAVVLLLSFSMVASAAQQDLESRVKELAKLAETGKSAVVPGEPMLGLVMAALDHVGWLNIYKGVLMGTAQYRNGLTTFSGQNSAEIQMAEVEDLITKGAKAVILNPVDSAALSAAVVKANQAGVPVITLDRSVTGGKVAAMVESDNRECGRLSVRLMAKAVGNKKVKVLVLQGDLATSAGLERHEGFMEEVKKYPNLQVVSVLPAYWKPEVANAATMDAFQANPDIGAIYLPSDNLYTETVLAALKQLGKLYPVGDPKHVVIVGVDGGPNICDAIRSGYADGSASQDLHGMGKTAVELALKAIKGEKIADPIHRIPPTAITKENVNDPNLWANVKF
ncbi:MAG: sugar ABC transporter substrate-binding protein [Firmicutes bacterium]|jgi:ABC-type sugar transport system substrate-binding protein|nr:sugar ABC transporter substrate-binding protein [Bacillota bacterium]MDH7495717.1 sugar ABC transporter substrate-binding protein [Bacillota bacterium]